MIRFIYRIRLNPLTLIGFSLTLRSLAHAQAVGPPPEAVRAAFEKLKLLKHDSVETTGDTHQKPGTKVTYRVVAGGSAVIDTLFPGQDHKTVIAYRMDGNALVLTHYCSAHKSILDKSLGYHARTDLLRLHCLHQYQPAQTRPHPQRPSSLARRRRCPQ